MKNNILFCSVWLALYLQEISIKAHEANKIWKHQLILWSVVFLEKLVVAQLVNKSSPTLREGERVKKKPSPGP
jgi:hypothetical protein